MSSNPSIGSSGAGAIGSHSKRQFAESNPHTLVGLQKVKVQLEKEISKLNRQQATAVTNIANHQQAMKMTWRLLQQRRMVESPALSRSKQDSEDANEPGSRKGLFHSKTKLYVRNTPTVYHPETKGGEENLSSSSATMVKAAAPPTNCELEDHQTRSSFQRGHYSTSIAAKHQNSPYISSPYNFRRDIHLHPKFVGKSNDSTQQHASNKSSCEGGPQIKGTLPQKESLKLPPIVSSSSQPQLVTASSIIDKKTLLKASAIMGGDLSSHSTASFKGFYSNPKPSSQPILASPVKPEKPSKVHVNLQEDTDQEEMENEQIIAKTSSELTLAEQFQQIKHCRYIRRYHPDGTALEEYY